ncbi:4-(cytidine 5'-diphospho)-2-C-methyl-D-erythritol kinase [candidate division KSB1 bacterium]
MRKKIKLLSNAKINLGLNVLNKRDDGFHNIETLYIPVTLYDELTIEQNENIFLQTDNSDIPVDERNTVYKAAVLLKNRFKNNYGCSIFLKKHIPHGAGLGGGSSNAAFTLTGLNELWDLKLSLDELSDIALEIGSDVPFFLLNRPAIGKGRGEILEPVEFNLKFKALLIYPNTIIDTGKVYNKVKIDLTNKEKNATFFTKIGELQELDGLNALKNHLESVVFREYPQIKLLKNDLYNDGAVFSSMSGSGSTVFGLFDENTDLDSIKRKYAGTNRVFEVMPINI